jgi:hypothetical protein
MSIKTYLIGRNPNVSQGEIAVKINDPSKKVSSNHCRIIFDGANFFIEDLISVNGTFVDGEKINSRTLVNINSNIKLGENYAFYLTNPIIQSSLQSLQETQSLNQTQLETPQNSQKFIIKNQNSGKQLNVSLDTDNKFFSFITPYLQYIDNGIFFKNPIISVYAVFAFLFLLIPFSILIKSGVFNNNYLTGKDFFALILMWLFITFNSWVCFQLLWNRRKELKENINASDDYKATPIIAHLVKTLGEVIGTTTVIIGVGMSLILAIFYSGYSGVISSIVRDVPFFNRDFFGNDLQFLNIFIFPIFGYIIIIFFKFLSETISVLPSIANNTKK